MWEGISGFFVKVWNGIKDTFNNIFGGVVDGIKAQIERIKTIFNEIISFVKNVFTGNWQDAWENVKNIFANIFEGIKEHFKMPINWIISGLNKFIEGINKIKIPDWVPLVGGKGFSITPIPALASGGNIQESGRVLVGERGPEYLDLPKGARVSPLPKETEQISEQRANNFTLHIGTLIADDYGLKKLERKLREFRVGEDERLGVATT